MLPVTRGNPEKLFSTFSSIIPLFLPCPALSVQLPWPSSAVSSLSWPLTLWSVPYHLPCPICFSRLSLPCSCSFHPYLLYLLGEWGGPVGEGCVWWWLPLDLDVWLSCVRAPEHVRPPDHRGVMEKMLLNFPPYTNQTNTVEEWNLCQSNRRGVLYQSQPQLNMD